MLPENKLVFEYRLRCVFRKSSYAFDFKLLASQFMPPLIAVCKELPGGSIREFAFSRMVQTRVAQFLQCSLIALLCTLGCPMGTEAVAQDVVANHDQLLAELALQAQLLNDPSYRIRQLARWRLQMYPRLTIDVIRDQIDQADHNSGSQLIDLLTIFATQDDIALSLDAMALLQQSANDISLVGRLAKNSLSAIADLQEEQAIEILVQNEAYVGPRNFKINAQVDQGDEMSLHINNGFSGNDEAIKWIRFLKSVETVYLEGEQIDRRIIKAISELTQVKNLKLRHVNLHADDLRLFASFENLQHLGLNYVNVGDDAVEVFTELPISESLRLYGTEISREGIARLKKQLDGIDIYGGRGGFLGVATGRLDTIVSMVTPNSGAFRGGIRRFDRLTAINGIHIDNFEDLRGELGKYLPEDTIRVALVRGTQELELEVTLTEDED